MPIVDSRGLEKQIGRTFQPYCFGANYLALVKTGMNDRNKRNIVFVEKG